MDAILQVGKNADHFMYNSLKVSRTREEILNNASSRYAPALVLNQITALLNSSEETFAFVGKPCDITAIKNYIQNNLKSDLKDFFVKWAKENEIEIGFKAPEQFQKACKETG